MNVDSIADEIDRAARVRQNSFHGTHWSHTGFCFWWDGKHVVKVRRVAGSRINGCRGLFAGRASVREENRNVMLSELFNHGEDVGHFRAY